jgi:GntR family transcriptional regulator / MocR family aminotransferase
MAIPTSPVRSWTFPITLESRPEQPVFLRIARAVAEDIRRGRLKPGSRLPGTRELAATLSVHRNTVVAAYHELQAEGWTEAAPARGTFVSRSMPEVRSRSFSPARAGVPAHAGFELTVPAPPLERLRPGMLLMPGGVPDVRLAPVAALARAYRRAVSRHASSVLAYSDPHGHPRLRAAIAAMLAATRGLAAAAEDVIVTRGSQMALHLVARALIAPGDVVAVEALGYRPAWEAFKNHGARLLPVRVDREGLDVAALTEITRRRRLRAIYLTPHHHYPSMVTLSAGRRVALLDLARRERIAIVGQRFTFDGRRIPYARFGFAALSERELADAVRRLVKALPYPSPRTR